MTTKQKTAILFLLALAIGLCLKIYFSIFYVPPSQEIEIPETAPIPQSSRAHEIGLQFIVDSTTISESERKRIVTRLNEIVDEMNGYYRNSRVYLTARVNHVEFAPIASKNTVGILEDMHLGRGAFRTLFASADVYGADFSVAIVDDIQVNGKEICGRGYDVNQTIEELSATNRSVAVVQLACGAHTLIHELGHLMGLNHGHHIDSCKPKLGHKSAITPYANGYAVGNCDGKPQPGEFGTIMVGGWMRSVNGQNKNKLEIFSNPDIYHDECGESRRCGDPRFADAARALNEYAPIYAAHEEPDVHILDFPDSALKKCIANSYRGREIADLDSLTCTYAGIEDLSGLEQLTALKTIDLSNNRITSLAPLFQMAFGRVHRIVLTGNAGISCKEVETLRNYAANMQLVGVGSCFGK